MTSLVTVQWDVSKSMGAPPRRVLVCGDTFVTQAELSEPSVVLLHGLHHTHYAFHQPTRSKLRGLLRVDTASSCQAIQRIGSGLRYIADVSADSTNDEQQRLSRVSLESLQVEVIHWALLIFSRTRRLSCALIDAEVAFPLLRALPFSSRVDLMETAARRHGCGLVLWRDNNLVCVDTATPLLAVPHPTRNGLRATRATALAAASAMSFVDTQLSELVQHVDHVHRRVQRCLMDDPCHSFASSTGVARALLVSLQVVSAFTEFATMCPSARAFLHANLYPLCVSGGFRFHSETRQRVAHIMRKKALKPVDFVPVFELALAGALAPRSVQPLTAHCGSQPIVPAGLDDGGASAFFSTQYADTASQAPGDAAVAPQEGEVPPSVVVAVSVADLTLATLRNEEAAALVASSTKIRCTSPVDHTGALGYINPLLLFGKRGASGWLQLTVDPSLLKRGH